MLEKIKEKIEGLKEEWFEEEQYVYSSKAQQCIWNFCAGAGATFWFYAIVLWIAGMARKQRIQLNWINK